MPKINVVRSQLTMLMADTLRSTPRLGDMGTTRRMFVHGWKDNKLVVTIQGDDFDAEPALKVSVKLEVEEVE